VALQRRDIPRAWPRCPISFSNNGRPDPRDCARVYAFMAVAQRPPRLQDAKRARRGCRPRPGDDRFEPCPTFRRLDPSRLRDRYARTGRRELRQRSGFITGVTGTSDVDGEAEGILFNGYAGLIRGNYIASVLPGAGIANGIKSNVGYLSIVEQNVILNPSATAGRGIDVNAVSTRPVCLNNRVRNFTVSAYDTCIDGGGNFSN